MRLRIAFRTSRLRVHNLDPFSGSSLGVKLAEAFCYRADFAIANLAIVQLGDRGQLTHCAGAKHLISTVNIDD